MKLKDKYGLEYRTIKKDGNYFLITSVLDKYTQKLKVKVEVKGKKNIFTYIKNNQLEVVK